MGSLSKFILAFLIVSIIVCCIIVNEVDASSVGGSISSGTLWTKANSPYSLTSDVTIYTGATLTVETGTTVNLNGFSITTEREGTLIAKASKDDPTHFNNGKIVLQYSNGSIIENAVLLGTSIKIAGGAPTIACNAIIGQSMEGVGITAGGQSGKIIGNTISGWSAGISTSGKEAFLAPERVPTIEGNFISHNKAGIDVYLAMRGFYFSNDYPSIMNNTISDSTNIGINVYINGHGYGGGPLESLKIKYNNFENNVKNIRADSIQDVDVVKVVAQYNWWGTTDTVAIEQTFDGVVNYTPFLTEPTKMEAPIVSPIPMLPSQEPQTTPTDTPSNSVSPSLSPENTVKPTQTSNQNQQNNVENSFNITDSNTWPILVVGVMIALIIALVIKIKR